MLLILNIRRFPGRIIYKAKKTESNKMTFGSLKWKVRSLDRRVWYESLATVDHAFVSYVTLGKMIRSEWGFCGESGSRNLIIKYRRLARCPLFSKGHLASQSLNDLAIVSE